MICDCEEAHGCASISDGLDDIVKFSCGYFAVAVAIVTVKTDKR